MRIAIFTENFYPELSGISDSVIALAKELAQRGHFINFYVPKHPEKNFKKANLPVEEINLGKNIKVCRFFSLPFGGSTGQNRFAVPTGWRWVQVRRFKPDIIHTQDIYGAGLAAISAAKLLRVPLVGTNHTPILEFLKYSPIQTEWFNKAALKYVSWYYNRCAYVTAPSECVFAEMIVNGFAKPHEVVSNPIDVKIFTPGNEAQKIALKKELGFGTNAILCSGRLAPEKHVDDVLRALALIRKEIPDVELILTGHGSAELELKKLVRQLGLNEEAKFLGHVEIGQLIKLYRSSEIFTIMSTAETQCIAMMRAMACALPSVVARARGLTEYVNKKNGILVEPGDFKNLAEKLVFLLKNSNVRRELGESAHEYVQQFSVENIASQWEEIYAKVIALRQAQGKLIYKDK